MRDLATGPLRFVNRQAGSGTRLLFDALIEEAGVRPEEIQGYDTEEFTHLAVGALIASGAADCGFGIQAAAHQFGLPFLPVTRERYFFALASPRRPGEPRGRRAHRAIEIPAVPGTCRGPAGL